MIKNLHSSDPPGLSKYNFAGMFVAIAVDDAVVALAAVPGIARRTSDDLTAWVKGQNYDTYMAFRRGTVDVDTLPEQQREAIHAIIDVQRHAEDRVLFATSTAILMATIHLESTINVFLHHNISPTGSKAVELLAYTSKFILAYESLKVKMPGHVNEKIGELVAWRNDFAHGRPTKRPGGLVDTLSYRPLPDVPSCREAATEMAHLLRGFLLVANALIALNRSPDFIPPPGLYDTVAEHLDRCEAVIAEQAQ